MSLQPAAYFLLRTPLLPLDELDAWSTGLRAATANSDDLEAALAEDRAMLRDRLRQLVERPEVWEALFIASPDLQGSYQTWLRDADSRRGQRVERALVRYLERMAARSTPFGLFAGCAVGTAGETTALTLPPRGQYARHTRLDMHYLCGLIRALERDETIRAALRYRPTTGLYRLAERWHWTELTPDDAAHSHRHRRLAATPALDALIAGARLGETLAELARSPAFTPDMVDRRLFVSDLEPAATGSEPIHPLIARLEALAGAVPSASTAAESLRAVRDGLTELDNAGLGADLERYQSIQALLGAPPGPVEPAKLWQGELIKTPPAPAFTDRPADTGSLSLGHEVLAELERGVHLLHRLHHPRRSHLERFRDAFLLRYEATEGRLQVPLTEALDPELGLGFGPSTGHDGSAPLLEGLGLPKRSGDTAVLTGARHAVLFRRLAEVLAAGAHELELTDANIECLAHPAPPPLPDALSVTGALAAASPAALAAGQFTLLIQGVAGPSGARLAGRFCHGDPSLHQHVKAHLQAEEALRPGAIFAEIAHLPEPRAGNVIHRPAFREYEITYLAGTGDSPARQVPLDDLLVSVEGDQIVLRSASLGQEVVPRLTCAQNYFHQRTTSLYRFLAALQDQGVATGLGWDWGPLRFAPFLPRVRIGRLVLARACWRLDAAEAKTLDAPTSTERFRAAQTLRRSRGLPRYVRLAESDNELLIDFDNVLSIESFAQLLKTRADAVLVEAFPGPDDLCVTGPEGRFVHELAVPFVQAQPAVSIAAEKVERQTTAPRIATRSEQVFPPGSAWLYAKLYAAPSTVDELLRDLVRPLVDQVLASSAADGWFFIRYGDPDWHLRLRFHGAPARLHRDVLPLLQDAAAPFLADGRVRRLQVDTYDRETARYGGPEGTALAERFFAADSAATLAIVEAYSAADLADVRWRLCLAGMDQLLDDLGLSLEEKIQVLTDVRGAFGREHGADLAYERQLGERFRSERAALEPLLDREQPADSPLAAGLAALQARSEAVTPVMQALQEAAQAGRLTLPLTGLAPSYLHMHANRLLHTDHRRQELVLYDFLQRLYESCVARVRQP